ncbi:MAG: aminoacyl-tRNA hydrolase [Armatimonadetes bacterium]|nr:aminoacyl-tRNA hydrolase [Armatimonadota bacterium]
MILNPFRRSKTVQKPKLIIGLGNPGSDYHGTRHNVGWDAIDLLAKRHHLHVRARRNKATVGEGVIGEKKVILAKPLTFMNLSGQAVGGLVRRYRLEPSDILVICDDVHLPLGRLRIRARGSAGGHKGLISIIHALGTEDFARVRVGVGSPTKGDMVDHVLSRFSRAERVVAKESIARATDAVEMILAEDVGQAMNRFNAPASSEAEARIDKDASR